MPMDGGINISGPALGVITTLVVALAGVCVFLFRLLLKAKDDRITELCHERDAYRDALDRQLTTTEIAVRKLRAAKGQPPLPEVAPVVPEHRSPPTTKEWDTAAMQTARAREAVIALELGMPPRATPARIADVSEPKGVTMTPKELKAVAERFRMAADDEIAIEALADDIKKQHPADGDLGALCDRFKAAAADGDAVRVICDEVKAS